MLDGPILGLIWVFGWAVFYLALRLINTQRYRMKLELIHQERIMAMDKGLPAPELPEYEQPSTYISLFSRMTLNPKWPLGLGALSILTGVGVSVALKLSEEPYHHRVWSMGLIGVFFGLGLFVHYAVTRR